MRDGQDADVSQLPMVNRRLNAKAVLFLFASGSFFGLAWAAAMSALGAKSVYPTVEVVVALVACLLTGWVAHKHSSAVQDLQEAIVR